MYGISDPFVSLFCVDAFGRPSTLVELSCSNPELEGICNDCVGNKGRIT